jgi:hypothetical protein
MRELAVKVCALHAVSPRTCGRASCRGRFLYVNVNDSANGNCDDVQGRAVQAMGGGAAT